MLRLESTKYSNCGRPDFFKWSKITKYVFFKKEKNNTGTGVKALHALQQHGKQGVPAGTLKIVLTVASIAKPSKIRNSSWRAQDIRGRPKAAPSYFVSRQLEFLIFDGFATLPYCNTCNGLYDSENKKTTTPTPPGFFKNVPSLFLKSIFQQQFFDPRDHKHRILHEMFIRYRSKSSKPDGYDPNFVTIDIFK